MRHHHAVNRHAPLPVYRQIVEHLETDLATRYSTGARLPSEAQLAQAYDVSRLTLRRAMVELVRRGLVETVHGKGSFVAARPIRYDISSGRDASFTRSMQERGHRVETRLVGVRTEEGRTVEDIEVASQLGTTSALRRTDIVRLVDDQPWSLTATWFVPDRLPGLDAAWSGDSSLYTVLLERYGVRMHRRTRTFAAVAAGPSDAEWLMMPVASPVLQVRGLNVDDDGHPLAVVLHRYRGDRLQFSVDLG